MKIKIGKYTWNSKKCIPLQVIKYGVFVVGIIGLYKLMWVMYYALLPYSTMG